MPYEWKETVEQLRDFVENSKDLIQIIAPDGVLLYANRSWREALGVSGTDFCGRNIFGFLAPECREHCQTLFGRLMQGEDVGLFHVTFLALDGRRVEAEGHVSVRWEQGKPQHTRGIFRDVTEDLRKEAEIRRLALIASLTDNAVVLTDATGRVAWINEGFTRLTGYSLPEVMGRKPGSFLQGPLTDPETVRRMRARLSAGSGFREELLNYRKDGSTYWVSLEVQAILDQHGRVASYMSIQRDITQLRDAEQSLKDHATRLERRIEERTAALERTRHQFESLFEFAPDALILMDQGWMIRLANRKAVEMFGWEREEMVGKPVALLLPETGGQLANPSGSGETLKNEGGNGIGVRRARPGGAVAGAGTFPAEISVGSLAGVDGPMTVVAVRDVTERVQAEKRLNRTRRLEAIGQLAGGVAHDLNNALAPILMASSLLRGRHPESREIIATVESCTERCADMVRQLLTFARGSDGARVLVRPNDLLREMARIVRGTFPKNIELRLSAAPDVSVVRGDPTQLHQVLLNLCVNARDAMPEGGVLSMSVHNQTVDKEFAGTVAEARPGLHVVLEVSDTGVGIAPEVVDQVFDPFFTTKSPDQGTGLGLSTVLGIVKGHGGFIRLESQPGRGTRFFVFLPAAEDDEEVRTAGPANTGCRPFGRDRTLLLVDDELNIRTILSVVLRQLGFRVLTAGNGEEARELAAAHFAVIQGVVTDLNMPRLGGVKLIRALREWLPSIPVLVSTGRLEPGVEQELGFLGVRNILTKPFNKELLVRALQEALGPGESGMRSVEGTAP